MSTTDLSWGASFGTQLLAEISLLEAKAKQTKEEELDNEALIKLEAAELTEDKTQANEALQLEAAKLTEEVADVKSCSRYVKSQFSSGTCIPDGSTFLVLYAVLKYP